MSLLPKQLIKSSESSPRDLIIYSQPKMGKTTIMAELTKKLDGKGLILNLEPGGTDYVDGYYVNCYENPTDQFTEALKRYKSIVQELKENPGMYDYLIIDSLTVLDAWSDIAGTYKYMSSPIGKNFNRDQKSGRMFTHNDLEWKSVSTLGDGAGYRWTRMWFMEQIDLLSSLAPYRVWIGHVKDKFIKQDGGADIISGHEINLTGKLKNMLTVRVSTLAKLVADDNKRYLSFEVDNDNLIGGSRVPHLVGKILISEKTEEGYETYWDKIYPILNQEKTTKTKSTKETNN
jgi:hypothetical protein